MKGREYPRVRSEVETLELVLAGRSIARYGDGEFKMAEHNASIKSQDAHPALSQRLREILKDSGECLVGIPNIYSNTPKATFWNKFTKYASLLTDRPYVSSFITRPDSAPWINTADYWRRVEALWVDQDITVVGGSGKSLKPEDLVGARAITHVHCRRQHAWQDYDEILHRIGTPTRALICLGPTATVLAVELCRRGVHAIDLGHIAMFLRKYRKGDQMVVTEDDKAHDAVAVA